MPKQTTTTVWSSETDLDGIFAELGDSAKVAIDRKEPEWCAGHVRTVHFDPTEPISLDWIQKMVGGTKLQIRVYGARTSENKSGYLGARTIDIFGPPKDGKGIEVTQGPDGEAVPINQLQVAIDRFNKKVGALQSPIPDPPSPGEISTQTPSPLSDTNLVQALITAQAKQNELMLTMMQQRVNQLETILYTQPPGQTPGQPFDPLASVKQTAEAISMIEGIKNSIGGGGGDEGDGMMSMAGELLKTVMAAKQQQPRPRQPQPRGALRGPVKSRSLPPPTRSPESLINCQGYPLKMQPTW